MKYHLNIVKNVNTRDKPDPKDVKILNTENENIAESN